MTITTKKQAHYLILIGTVMAFFGALIAFLTDFDGILLILGAIVLYEVVARSEPGRDIFPKQTSFLPKNKVMFWIVVGAGILLTVNSVLELWKFVFAG